MKIFRIEVLVEEGRGCDKKKVWKKVRPTHGEPYAYETREEAEKYRRICYGEVIDETRITEEEA